MRWPTSISCRLLGSSVVSTRAWPSISGALPAARMRAKPGPAAARAQIVEPAAHLRLGHVLALQELGVLGRQLLDEARRHARRPLIVDPPVGGVGDGQRALRPGDADVGEPPLLLERLEAALVDRPLVREHALLPAGQEHGVELEALGAVQGHQR